MSERILVPLDGSSLGEAALEYVNSFIEKLCPETKVTVVLFHVVHNIDINVNMGSYYGEFMSVDPRFTAEEMDNLKKRSQLYLTRASKMLKGSNIEVKNVIVEGVNPAEEIIKAENVYECDLIAMSTHGRGGFSRWAFGSVTDKVLRGGTVPVLLVRAKDS